MLLKLSGGLRQLFVSTVATQGVPAISILCLIWVFGLFVGAPVMPLWRALLMFVGFGLALTLFHCVLFFVIAKVKISKSYLYVGIRKWKNRKLKKYSWETHVIGGVHCAVLAFTISDKELVRIALPLNLSRDEVGRTLTTLGIPND